MNGDGVAVVPTLGPDVQVRVAAGITRFDMLCGEQTWLSIERLTRRWGEDRALSSSAVDRLVTLIRATMRHGLRFDPRGLTVTLRWLDVDRVRIDVRWHGCRDTARRAEPESDPGSIAAAIDSFSEGWGFGTGADGPVQWMVVNTG